MMAQKGRRVPGDGLENVGFIPYRYRLVLSAPVSLTYKFELFGVGLSDVPRCKCGTGTLDVKGDGFYCVYHSSSPQASKDRCLFSLDILSVC